jgi:hypothetical protein
MPKATVLDTSHAQSYRFRHISCPKPTVDVVQLSPKFTSPTVDVVQLSSQMTKANSRCSTIIIENLKGADSGN